LKIAVSGILIFKRNLLFSLTYYLGAKNLKNYIQGYIMLL